MEYISKQCDQILGRRGPVWPIVIMGHVMVKIAHALIAELRRPFWGFLMADEFESKLVSEAVIIGSACPAKRIGHFATTSLSGAGTSSFMSAG